MDKGFLKFFSEHSETIIVLGIILLAAMIINTARLSYHKNRIKDALDTKNLLYIKNYENKSVEEVEDKNAEISPDTIRSFEMEYNRSRAIHSTLSQLISIFPLLGILGTVAGLMLSTTYSAQPDLANIPLDIALKTTYYGLICAIGLKVFDVIVPTRIIENINDMLDDFDKKLTLMEMFGKSKAE